MIIKEIKGDLFKNDKKYALAHCISQDCKMGAGIAFSFDIRFKGMKSYCKRVIKENKLEYPCIVPYFSEEQPVFNLVTKMNYWDKPTYKTLRSTIRSMAYLCKNVKYLAIPKLGCGLDRLKWNKVKKIIEEEFKDLDIEIVVNYL